MIDGIRDGIVPRGVQVRAWPNIGSGLIDVILVADVGLNYANRVVGKPIEFALVDQADPYPRPPTMTLDSVAAQLLIDQLWNCGVRPSEGTGSAGSLAATERHLADMRAIAFKQMGIE